MNVKRNTIGVLLIITALLIMQIPIPEAAAAASDFKIEGNKLVSYVGTASSVAIPSSVKYIGESAFENNENITKIIIPNSVDKIAAYAFWGCSQLEEVRLGDGLKEIGDFSFANCKGLTTISIPENIKRIGIMAFADCINLTTIYIPETVEDIHENAFDGCYRLEIGSEENTVGREFAELFERKKAEMAEYEDNFGYQNTEQREDVESDFVEDTENDTVEDIENDTMEDTENDTVEDTENDIMEDIENGMIDNLEEDSNLNRQNIIGETKVVGGKAVVFMDKKNVNVYLNQVIISGNLYDNDSTSENEIEGIKKNNASKFSIIDNKIIADGAYYAANNLDTVMLPSTIIEIGEFAYARSSLKHIVIPEGATTIGYGAFYHCDALEEISIPSSINLIEPKALLYTKWLEDFQSYSTDNFLIVGDQILVGYKGKEVNVVIPEGVKQIGPEVFQGMETIESINFPDSLITIGESAFEDCINLSMISGGNNIRFIKDRAFKNCNLNQYLIGNQVEEIGLGAFATNDSSIQSIISADNKQPKLSYEKTATRLSNEEYRTDILDGIAGELEVIQKENNSSQSGIRIISDIEDVLVSFENNSSAFELYLTLETSEEVAKAYERVYGNQIPDLVCYNIDLIESSSGISITKLGSQEVTISMPIPKNFIGMDLQVVALDRNGQLELLQTSTSENVVSFKTNHFSAFGIYSRGVLSAEKDEKDSSPDTGDNHIHPKWILGGGILFLGIYILLSKKKYINNL